MLLEFSVENHRAIREKQTFLMFAGDDNDNTRPNRAINTGFSYAPRVLTSACIVGPNGAGKSSLIDAMRFASNFARSIHRHEDDDEIDVEPFAFHTEWNDNPSEFEMVFIQNDMIYQYGFSLTRSRVIAEWLNAIDKNNVEPRKLFSRTYRESDGEYDFFINETEYKDQTEFWRSVTKSNVLFLSLADEFNITEDIENARVWMSTKFVTRQIASFRRPLSPYVARRFAEDGWKDRVLDFLKRTGISVDDILVDRREYDGYSRWVVAFGRKNNLSQPVWMNLHNESRGTRDLFELAPPILDALERGRTLVVDELNLGLHPLAFESLVAMFYNPEINRHNAQLIFTTHDLASIDHARIDYDQIWLVNKNDELAAELYPFSDFETSGKRTFGQGYLQGLYGAIPRISRIRQ